MLMKYFSMLRYSCFDFAHKVVCIGNGKPITAFQKRKKNSTGYLISRLSNFFFLPNLNTSNTKKKKSYNLKSHENS